MGHDPQHSEQADCRFGWRFAETHPRESERLAALAETGLIGGPSDPLQMDAVRLASEICETPIAAVSLVGVDLQWFVASRGLGVSETPKSMSFCAHTIVNEGPLIVPDASKDDRFSGNPLVTGSPFIRFYAGVPLRGSDDLPLGTLCIIDSKPREITDSQFACLKTLASLVSSQIELLRRNRQLAVRQAETNELHGRLTKIAACLPGVIYQFRLRPDGTSCFPYASAGIRSIYRVTPEQVRDDASCVFGILHPDDLSRVSESIETSARTLADWKCEYRVRYADGTERWLLGHATPQRDPDGGTLWHGFIKDISDRRATQEATERLNLELDRARQKAEAASRAKSAFLANMSHEIRTPLTAILGFADLLGEDRAGGMNPEARQQALRTIRSASTHLLTIINDVLDISKIEADQMTLEAIDTSPLAIVREIVEILRPEAEGKGITISAELLTPIPASIISDPTRLRQILMNLVGNAVKFTEAGRVVLSLSMCDRDGGQHLLVDVTDSGMGLTRQAAESLFTPFGQGDESVTRRFGGTGLGLTICHRLARIMGGSVSLTRTELGRGSSFRVDLPITFAADSTLVASLHADATPAPAARPITQIRGRILLAEDGPDNQRLISFHLRKAGATVEIAANGRIALEMFEQAAASGSPFDLLVTDIQMPEMDGLTLTRTLRATANRLPIVALTAHAMAEDRDRCLASGCDDYLSKPIDKAKLIAACGKWLSVATTAPARVEQPSITA